MHNRTTYTFSDLVLGQTAQFTAKISEDLVAKFADLSGDYNPLHMDKEFAQHSLFRGRIAHGMLLSSLFSRLVGMHLPGENALYLSQSLNFRNPCTIGSTVTVRGTIVHKSEAAGTITLRTEIADEGAEILVEGEALVKVLQ